MTMKHRDQLIKECTQDLELAKAQRHHPWIETLTKRLADLKRIKVADAVDTCKLPTPEPVESDDPFIR